ncbi:cytochrome [Aliishimia ponticola]|uniref:Cytochrome n=1 Tax=Aliishimia ponticola TaxID=2499833 RepID=A0A4S4NHG0_9RHOB|nr:cytochrome b/b6 domain-containing protein [Aliishimia ponticola]THH38295.1 cytochrome [Aliishimia ponticola]
MATTNSHHRYGTVSKSFHWLTALLILTLIPLGIIANGLPFDTGEQLARKAFLFSLHKTLGVTVFFVALARIAWALSQPKPGPLHPDRRVEHWAAETVHWLLYGSLLLVPMSGWIHHAATTGFAPIWWPFGQSLPFVPKDDAVAGVFAGLHIVFERVLAASILLHVAGALKHHFIDRDSTLRRMWFGQTTTPEAGAHRSAAAPILSALVVWGAALGIGSAIGVFGGHGTAAPQAAALETVASDWTVTDGKIAITTQQFGSTVEGSFADWTAAITFDPDVPQGKAGEVEVTISIPSLTLGSVTDQALGPDYFAAENYPTAVFKADIVTIADGYAADGTLTIKDHTVPVTLPYSLVRDGETASMESTLILDRLDFGIGENMADESSLGFSVEVNVAVTATRNAD